MQQQQQQSCEIFGDGGVCGNQEEDGAGWEGGR